MTEKAKDRSLESEWLDEIGQVEEQLIQFTSLEDLHRMSFRSVSEESGIHNPSLLKGEDPRGWVDELGLNFTPPPSGLGGGAQLDLSAGESSAKGAFSISQQGLTPVQEMPSSEQSLEVNLAQRGMKSARQAHQAPQVSQAPQYSSAEYEDEDEIETRHIPWWMYPLVAAVLITLGLVAGSYLSKLLPVKRHQTPITPVQMTTVKDSIPSQVEEMEAPKEETPAPPSEDDIILEGEIDFE